MKFKIYIFIIIIFLGSCRTTPIILEEEPEIHMEPDISLEEYLEKTTNYTIDLKKYLDEIINQIKHKVPYIDLRKKEDKIK